MAPPSTAAASGSVPFPISLTPASRSPNRLCRSLRPLNQFLHSFPSPFGRNALHRAYWSATLTAQSSRAAFPQLRTERIKSLPPEGGVHDYVTLESSSPTGDTAKG